MDIVYQACHCLRRDEVDKKVDVHCLRGATTLNSKQTQTCTGAREESDRKAVKALDLKVMATKPSHAACLHIETGQKC